MKHLLFRIVLVLLISSCAPWQGTTFPLASPVVEDTPNMPVETPSTPSTEISTLNSKFHLAGYEQRQLSCGIYIETTWGGGETEWGDPILLPAHTRSHFPTPVFDVQGQLYLLDLTNHRILIYDGETNFPVQTIELPSKYYSYPQNQNPVIPSSIGVTITNILVPYGLDRVGILSLDGNELIDVVLPYHYNLMAPVLQPIWVDSQKNILIASMSIKST